MGRRSLAETWTYLDTDGLEMPRGSEGEPFVPAAMPNHNDDTLGFSFFRGRWDEADFSSITIPRTFFGRSTLNGVDFRDTDLTESRMCWNDFTKCDFRGADLSRCDMRASKFVDCDFGGAILRNADLRRSSFRGPEFTGADMRGAVADDDVYTIGIGDDQYETMNWQDEPGEEPPGG